MHLDVKLIVKMFSMILCEIDCTAIVSIVSKYSVRLISCIVLLETPIIMIKVSVIDVEI